MKRYITALLVAANLIAGCSEQDSACCSKPAESALEHTGAPLKASLAAHTTEMSLYNLDAEWTNQHGEQLQLEALKGKIQMVAMIYTGCDYACPRIIADLKRIEAAIKEYKRSDVGIVLVTMDPANDTAEKLKAFATKNKLDADRWTLLTSNENNIQELSALLNVKYKKESNGYIAHSNIITVLDAEGEMVHQQEGLGIDPDETVNAISTLLKKI
jgi:protein SCO1